MSYKVGDLVRIKTWDQMTREYGYGPDPYGDHINTSPCFVDGMSKYCGTDMEIKWISGDTPLFEKPYYRMRSDDTWMFPEDSIECVVLHHMNSEKLPFQDDRVAKHEEICTELTVLYERKNHDYGNSFGDGMKEYGMIMPVIRLEDKLRRLKSLVKSGDIKVQDESIRDTLMDLANYSIMTLIEMDMEGSE